MAKEEKRHTPTGSVRDKEVMHATHREMPGKFTVVDLSADRPRRRQRFAAKDDSGMLEDQKKS